MKDLTGQRFGRLTVLGFDSRVDYGNYISYYWKCRCDCGEITYVNSRSLFSGGTKSCGCLRKEVCAKNGIKTAKEKAMRITYNGKTLDIKGWSEEIGVPESTIRKRIYNGDPVEKALFPGKFSAGRKGKTRRELQKKVVIHGVEYTIGEASEEFGIPYSVLYQRIRRGFSEDEIISKNPIDKRKHKRYNK